MDHAPALGAAALAVHAPARHRGGDQELPCRCTRRAQPVEVVTHCPAAPGELSAVGLLIEIGLLDPHLRPLDLELFRHDHRQRRLHALTDLRVLRHDRDGPIPGNAHERVERHTVG